MATSTHQTQEASLLGVGFTTDTAIAWRNTLSAVMDIIGNQVNMCATADGISIRSMDSTKTSFLEATFHTSYFDMGYEYLYSGEKYVFGVSLESIVKVLKSIKRKTEDALSINVTDTHLFLILTDNTREQIFKIPLMDIPSDEMEVPSMTYSYVTTWSTESYTRAMQELGLAGTTKVGIQVSPETPPRMRFHGEGDLADSQLLMESGQEGFQWTHVTDGVEVHNNYTYPYLKKCASVADVTGTHVILSTSPKYPLSIRIPLCPDTEISCFSLHIAPMADE